MCYGLSEEVPCSFLDKNHLATASLPLGQLQETAYLPPQRTRWEALSTLGLSLLAALQSPSEEYKIMSSPLSAVCVLPALAIP